MGRADWPATGPPGTPRQSARFASHWAKRVLCADRHIAWMGCGHRRGTGAWIKVQIRRGLLFIPDDNQTFARRPTTLPPLP